MPNTNFQNLNLAQNQMIYMQNLWTYYANMHNLMLIKSQKKQIFNQLIWYQANLIAESAIKLF